MDYTHHPREKLCLFPTKVIIPNNTGIFLLFIVLSRVMVAKWDYCHLLNGLIWHALDATCRLIHSWSGGGEEVMFTATWHELAVREREMIWSCDDSRDHTAWLAAATWQIKNTGKSDPGWLLWTANTPSSLSIISNWASGSNEGREEKTICPSIKSMKCKVSAVLCIQMFGEEMTGLQRSCSYGG